MRGLNSGCVDLIYLDPPFNSNRNYGAPIGSKAAGAAFKDMWTLDDVKDEEHGLLADKVPSAYKVIEAAYGTAGRSMQAYLIFMAVRLIEMKRTLKDSGSIFLHCDPTAGHYLKILMDALFGRVNFVNEIVWCYKGRNNTKRSFEKKTDHLYFYGKSSHRYFNLEGAKRDNDLIHSARYNKEDEVGRYALVKGRNGEYTKHYLKQKVIAENWWEIPYVRGKEYTGYPTQKPLALLERIIKATSNPNDLIFDPFCGCATTLVAAQRLTRDWIGCDVSKMAVTLVNARIREKQPLFRAINPDGNPKRTDTRDIPNYKVQGHLLYGKQKGICGGCNLHFPYGGMSIDHKHPKSKGGTDELDNLQMLCMRCNSSKGNKTMAEWNASRKKIL